MKTIRVFLAVMTAGAVGFVASGCKNPDDAKTAAPATMDKAAEADTTAPAPDTQKPKDHPAH
jgi:hypothetical protein